MFLGEDSDELHDRAEDPGCQEVVRDLTERVLDGWNPEAVAQDMADLREDGTILKDWALHTKPEDAYRWDLRPEMDYLDEPAA
jgi:hypothetical protein